MGPPPMKLRESGLYARGSVSSSLGNRNDAPSVSFFQLEVRNCKETKQLPGFGAGSAKDPCEWGIRIFFLHGHLASTREAPGRQVSGQSRLKQVKTCLQG